MRNLLILTALCGAFAIRGLRLFSESGKTGGHCSFQFHFSGLRTSDVDWLRRAALDELTDSDDKVLQPPPPGPKKEGKRERYFPFKLKPFGVSDEDEDTTSLSRKQRIARGLRKGKNAAKFAVTAPIVLPLAIAHREVKIARSKRRNSPSSREKELQKMRKQTEKLNAAGKLPAGMAPQGNSYFDD
jgi:hypothetical protein